MSAEGNVQTAQAHVWTFKDGKLARFEAFQDTAALVAANS
jgi:ketosteroid isomerase-like protein